jgi:hypothetical protein
MTICILLGRGYHIKIVLHVEQVARCSSLLRENIENAEQEEHLSKIGSQISKNARDR